MGVFEKPLPLFAERLFPGTVGVAEHARDQADASLDNGHRGDLTARQNKVAEGYFSIDKGTHALVEAFVASANERNVRMRDQVGCYSLCKRSTLGRE